MGSVTVLKNSSVSIDLAIDYRDNGWTISNGVATHSSCNSGLIKLNGYPFKVGVPNIFRYVVSGYSSGGVNINVGGQSGATDTSNGEKVVVITPTNADDEISFYSDGNLSVQLLEVYTDTASTNGTALYFSEPNNRWTMYSSIRPDFMLKFITGFYMWQNGVLWESHTNPTHNNFFGIQYPSIITFYVNLEPTVVKNFFSIREKSNKVWSVTDVEILESYGKPNGQRSRIKSGNFKHLQGDYFADFLRDMNDSRFNTELDALMRGALLQGNVAKITIENKDNTEVRLLSVDVILSKQEYTY